MPTEIISTLLDNTYFADLGDQIVVSSDVGVVTADDCGITNRTEQDVDNSVLGRRSISAGLIGVNWGGDISSANVTVAGRIDVPSMAFRSTQIS